MTQLTRTPEEEAAGVFFIGTALLHKVIGIEDLAVLVGRSPDAIRKKAQRYVNGRQPGSLAAIRIGRSRTFYILWEAAPHSQDEWEARFPAAERLD